MNGLIRTFILCSVVVFVTLFLAADVVAGEFEDGLDAYNQSDYATALRKWRPLAEQGPAQAQVNLGVMYNKGRGVPQDAREAVKWFYMAAEQGHTAAQYNLVRQVQAYLAELGYSPGPIDGILGPRTKSALRQYQAARGLQTTGLSCTVTNNTPRHRKRKDGRMSAPGYLGGTWHSAVWTLVLPGALAPDMVSRRAAHGEKRGFIFPIRMELIALRHQVAVYKQSISRPKLQPSDRWFWVWLSRLWPGWRDALEFTTPHRVGLAEETIPRLLATLKSERQTGSSTHLQRSPGVDPGHVASQPDLGIATHRRRAPQARHHRGQIERRDVPTAYPKAAVAYNEGG